MIFQKCFRWSGRRTLSLRLWQAKFHRRCALFARTTLSVPKCCSMQRIHGWTVKKKRKSTKCERRQKASSSGFWALKMMKSLSLKLMSYRTLLHSKTSRSGNKKSRSGSLIKKRKEIRMTSIKATCNLNPAQGQSSASLPRGFYRNLVKDSLGRF